MNPALRLYARRLRQDPVRHVRELQGCDSLEPYQENVLRAIENHSRVAISACHSIGKSFTTAKAVLWFGNTHPGCRIITTAPTLNQVKNILWSEIRSGHARSKYPLGGTLNLTEWKIADNWFAIGFTSKYEAGASNGQSTASSFQGFHARDVLVIFDEATGIHRQIWTQAEGLMTAGNVKWVAIANPTSKNSEFHKCFSDPLWHRIYLSCFDSPNFRANGIHNVQDLAAELDAMKGLSDDGQAERLSSYKEVSHSLITVKWVVGYANKLGIDHPLIVSKCLGKFPEEDEHVLMPLGIVEIAQGRESVAKSPPRIRLLGIDPARFGVDKTVLTLIEDWTTVAKKSVTKKDTGQVAGEAIVMLDGLVPATDAEVITVDGTGIGAGVVDRLNEVLREGKRLRKNTRIVESHFGSSALDKEHYANLKAEMFVKLSEDLHTKLDLPAESVYLEQLPTIIYSFDSKGRYVIESKDEYKRRTGLPSPDDADSLALANFGRYDQGNVGNFTDQMAQGDSGTHAGSLSEGDKW